MLENIFIVILSQKNINELVKSANSYLKAHGRNEINWLLKNAYTPEKHCLPVVMGGLTLE